MSTTAAVVPAAGALVSAASDACAPSPTNSAHGVPTPVSKPPFVTCSSGAGDGSGGIGPPDGGGDPTGGAGVTEAGGALDGGGADDGGG